MNDTSRMDRRKQGGAMSWGKKDTWFTVLFTVFFVGTFIVSQLLRLEEQVQTVSILGLLGVLFVICIGMYGKELSTEWTRFRENKFWLKIILSIFLMGGIIGLLQVIRSILPPEWLATGGTEEDIVYTISVIGLLLPAIQALMAPFYEEILFRYVMIGRMRSPLIKLIMLVIQAVFFGLIHTFNFNGNPLATIPYMVIAVYFGLIYLLFDNIWMSIIVHWLFNFMNSVLPLILILFYL